jgi:hypothetical protein
VRCYKPTFQPLSTSRTVSVSNNCCPVLCALFVFGSILHSFKEAERQGHMLL